MKAYVTCCFFQKIAFPIVLLACTVFRPCVFSGVYLLFLFINPFVPVVQKENSRSFPGHYVRAVFIISLLLTMAQAVFQITLVSLPPYAYFLKFCNEWESILRYIGLVRLDGIKPLSAVIWLSPEVLMLLYSTFQLFIISKFTSHRQVLIETGEVDTSTHTQSVKFTSKKLQIFSALGCFMSLFQLCVAACLLPSAIGGFYFLIFICSATVWASYRQLGKGFAWILRFVQFVGFIHLLILFLYQISYFQQFLKADSFLARLLGLEPIVKSDCNADPRDLNYHLISEWFTYLNPIAVYLMYYISGQTASILLYPKPKKKAGTFTRLERSNFNSSLPKIGSSRLSRTQTTHIRRWQNATRKVKDSNLAFEHPRSERMPLLRRSVGQTSRRSATSSGSADQADNIPMQQIGTEASEEQLGILDTIFLALCSLFYVVIQASYLVTNIVMMVWSIVYHSWLTLVLLMWANISWLFPNQRRFMLRSSPILVLYAIFLLIAQYIFTLNLTDKELPSIIDGFNLEKIGFYRPKTNKCIPLLIKSGFTAIFWVTMRQYMKEREEAKRTSTLADMVSPLQVTMTAAMSQQSEEIPTNKLIKLVGVFTQTFLTKYFIWVVAGMLFIIGITGTRMTAFRIIYMALFLLFVFLLQTSFRVWRSFMYMFWLIVIIYSMLILITIYTYQFDHFADYWEKYLFIPKDLQRDIGLETYKPAELLARLLIPTLFVIISVIQMHYFHDDFLKLTKIQDTAVTTSTEQSGDVRQSTSQTFQRRSRMRSDISYLKTIQSEYFGTWDMWKRRLININNIVWLFLEMHIMKVVLITIIFMCTNDFSAVHLILVVAVCISLSLGAQTIQCVRTFASALVSVMFLLRMIYQIDYIDHNNWTIDCFNDNSTTNSTSNSTVDYNMASWLGFEKLKKSESLFHLLQWYIMYLVISIFKSVIDFRQMSHRQEHGLPNVRPTVMFPEITRKEADKNTWNCIKFLLNYGFYKFGIECTLIATAIIICFRTDIYGVVYGIWLVVLCALNYHKKEKVWPCFIIFVVFVIPFQYIQVIGLPPFLCIEYPWSNSQFLRRVQEYLFLMDNEQPLAAKKIILDFILLLALTRQKIVFNIQNNYLKQNIPYPGGSNERIIYNVDDPDFVNPVPDFVDTIHNWLDIWKRILFHGFIWFTLIVIFLTGANRVNIFSIGYLLGTFIFLWQGQDLLLRPIEKIIKMWDRLVMYNVFVLLIKSGLQLLGCVYIDIIYQYACWAVEMFGISCVHYFHSVFGNKQAVTPCVEIKSSDVNFVWDLFCFACLIFQRRMFCSHYFFHIIDETKAMTVLASRGAELIEELRKKHAKEQVEREKLILENIKTKMERIKENQKKIQGPNYKDPANHFVDAGVPLAHDSSSMSSCTSPAGYHTPISESETLPPVAGGAAQPPSPSSALMTVSLEGYLEPQRMSFESPPHSDLNQRAPSLDESFPVFSPPPYVDVVSERSNVVRRRGHTRQISIGPPWMGGLTTPRQSIISNVQRSPQSHQTYTIFNPEHRPLYRKRIPKHNREAIRSGDYYMFDNIDDSDDFDYTYLEETTDESDRKLKGRDVTLSELLATLFSLEHKDIDTTTRILRARSLEQIKALRRASMPPSGQMLLRQTSTISAPPHLDYSPDDLSKDEQTPLVPTTSKDKEEDKRDDDDIKRVKDGEDGDEDGKSDSDESEGKEPRLSQKLAIWLLIIWTFIKSALLSLTLFLNKFSRNYRFVLKVLSKEKKMLKENKYFKSGIRRGSAEVWQPLPTTFKLVEKARTDPDAQEVELEKPSTSSAQESRLVPEIRVLAPSLERGLDNDYLLMSLSERNADSYISEEEKEEDVMVTEEQAVPVRLALAIWFLILSNSQIVCYFMVFLNQIMSASIISLPLPLMVFLWGSLTIPRPSKAFWVTMIAYVEIIVFIKCMFQFKFLPWNEDDGINTSPFYPPRILGIERKNHYVTYDLCLLIVIFFHRSILSSLGLWKTYSSSINWSDSFLYNENTPLVVNKPTSSKTSSQDECSDEMKNEDDNSTLVTPGGLVLTRPDAGDRKKKKDDGGSDEEESDAAPGHEHEHAKDSSTPEKVVSTASIYARTSAEINQEVDLVVVNADEHPKNTYFPHVIGLSVKRYFSPFTDFFKDLYDPRLRVAKDVYAYMFLCDFINFLVIIFGFSAFGTQGEGAGVQTYLKENRVPVPFLIMLGLQFLLILIDRALFLRKFIVGKIVFQFFTIIGVHIWMFFVLPAITERQFNSRLPPQIWYMMKCFYLLLSAYQIRSGYPTRILGNFLCKGYSYLNYGLFKCFMLCPFLFELRTIMDWMWTDTSMTLFDWLKMEDIFAYIFTLKCARHCENEFPQERGIKKKSIAKYLMGGGALLIIIIILWFPLVLFSLGKTVGVANLPVDVTLNIRIGTYQPIYSMSAQSNQIIPFTNQKWDTLNSIYYSIREKEATTFLSNYEAEDVAEIVLSGNSTMTWNISPPDETRLIEELNSTNAVTVRALYVIKRDVNSDKNTADLYYERSYSIPPFIDGNQTQNPTRRDLIKMLQNDQSIMPVLIPFFLPKFLKVTNHGDVEPIAELMRPIPTQNDQILRNITIKLSEQAGVKWWEIHEDCTGFNYERFINRIPGSKCASYIQIYTFNEKKFPDTLTFISGGGIISLYTTFVFFASRIVRGFFSDQFSKIMFEDLPNVDRIYQLCLDIYLVRETRELMLEEDLFAKLIFLYRSPETLIKWTRPKYEIEGDESEAEQRSAAQ